MDLQKFMLSLLLIMDTIGLAPIIHSMLAKCEPKRRLRILIREQLIALAFLLLFMFFGNNLMYLLGLEQTTLRIAGGVILFLIALGMVFPTISISVSHSGDETAETHEPFIVPIAVPLTVGPAAIALILLASAQTNPKFSYTELGGAICLVWFACTIFLILAQYFLKFLGKRGAVALERLMGMLLILLAVQMITEGCKEAGREKAPTDATVSEA